VLPLAHVAHYLWVLYVIPVLIVVASIVRSLIAQRKLSRGQSHED
jgi:heme exporter protein D